MVNWLNGACDEYKMVNRAEVEGKGARETTVSDRDQQNGPMSKDNELESKKLCMRVERCKVNEASAETNPLWEIPMMEHGVRDVDS